MSLDYDESIDGGCGEEADLYQCHRTSRYSFEGVAEAVVELVEADDNGVDDGAAIRVKVRGKSSAGKQCFLLLEEILGIIDQVSNFAIHYSALTINVSMMMSLLWLLHKTSCIEGSYRHVPRGVG